MKSPLRRRLCRRWDRNDALWVEGSGAAGAMSIFVRGGTLVAAGSWGLRRSVCQRSPAHQPRLTRPRIAISGDAQTGRPRAWRWSVAGVNCDGDMRWQRQRLLGAALRRRTLPRTKLPRCKIAMPRSAGVSSPNRPASGCRGDYPHASGRDERLMKSRQTCNSRLSITITNLCHDTRRKE